MVQQIIAILRLMGDSYDAKSQQSLGGLLQILMEHITEQLVNHSHNECDCRLPQSTF